MGVRQHQRDEAGRTICQPLQNKERSPLPWEGTNCHGFYPGDRIGIYPISQIPYREKGIVPRFSLAMVASEIAVDFSPYPALYPARSEISQREASRVGDQAIDRFRTALPASLEERSPYARSSPPV